MSTRLALFGAEGRAKAVHFAKGEDVGLVIELPRLRQVGRFTVIVDFEECCGTFSRGRCEYRRVNVDLAMII